MITQELFQLALHIKDPWFISDLQFDEHTKRLDIHVDFTKGSAFTYFDETTQQEIVGLKTYDTTNKQYRHLNFFEYECYIHTRVPRVKLPDGKVKRIKTPWEGLSNGFTLLFEALLMQLCQAMPVVKVANIVKVSDDKLWSMMERYIDTTRECKKRSKSDTNAGSVRTPMPFLIGQ